ncbi:hypothetical protein VNO78_30846 [Psophocarpus tetragonolobus]|uniref:Protein kinase domain-containing protein n=1 Tax=Psophocarpus tetragonolobus TaxID=3891 RepID=A0AAN9RXC8_PSOTE
MVIMWKERVLLVLLLFLVQQICASNKKQEHGCDPSSCGKISNITYPFRLKGDPQGCGDSRYELSCENNVTVVHLYSGKYHVQAINYDNFTIRVVDPGIQPSNYSTLPRYFFSPLNFSDLYYRTDFRYIVFMNCSHGVSENGRYVDTAPYINWESKGHHIYAIAGDLKARDIEVGCKVKLVAATSWWGLDTNKYSYSYTAMHMALLYGFQISSVHLACVDLCEESMCYFDPSSQTLQCWPQLKVIADVLTGIFKIVDGPRLKAESDYTVYDLAFISLGQCVLPYLAGRYLLGMTLFIALLIYKRRNKHLSMYENIENYLEQNNLMPIRYSYKEIKNMAKGFQDKLGKGGFGSVFKGRLRSGPIVAIKMLDKSKGNGQDFINEVATIGRIHHQNIVQLIGYCVEGKKRALVYDFMSNGSLDKFLFFKDGGMHLTYDKIYNIAIGVARGIAYLHCGCEMQILHFDIKPHNILLDENFIPKVSDFGLAKLYPIDNNIVTITAARGTIGYMAPELFYKNIGRTSQKADVYSFGMLLMEMASKRKNLNPLAEHSSQLYFPLWVYGQLEKEKDIEMEDGSLEEKQIAKKLIIIALWCIQLKPDDRPSMNKVIEMLEGEIESIEMPPKPSLYPNEMAIEDQSSDFISSSSYST